MAAEDLTIKAGLLMEAAEAQQSAMSGTLERLREHAAGLDGVVREEIRATLVEEMRNLAHDTHSACDALRQLKRAAGLRALLFTAVAAAVAAVVPLAMALWLLPSRAEVQALRAAREELAADVARLSERGGHAQLRHCGAERRLCVRVDRTAPAYGEGGDFLVVKGY